MQKVNSSGKKYWENTLLSINIVIDDILTCNVNKVYKYMILVVTGKYLCIFNYRGSFNLIISKTNHNSFTLKRIP